MYKKADKDEWHKKYKERLIESQRSTRVRPGMSRGWYGRV